MATTNCSLAIGRAYDVLGVLRIIGIGDLTDGRYSNPPPPVVAQNRQDYEQAQIAQTDYLLDEVGCKDAVRLFDMGCGNGRLLRQAQARGAWATGITLSQSQLTHCLRQGLDVWCLNYLDIPADWLGQFDCVTANGSIEHFVTVNDALENQTDSIYRAMFKIVHNLLKPGGRFVTTAIHFREKGQVDPHEITKGPHVHPKEFREYHFAAILQRVLHGWYPYPGQLESCAAGLFTCERSEDGTHDYHLTSEFWLRQSWLHLLVNPRVWWHLSWMAARWPSDVWDAFHYYLWDQSWAWQFRGEDPPTRLLRHTWVAI